MNRSEQFDKVDLTNCDREPIHLLGAIQPVGFLMALSTDWMVSRCSANIGEFFDIECDNLIGSPASLVLNDDAIHTLRNRLALLRSENAIERVFNTRLSDKSERSFDVAIHMSDGQIVIECEPSSEKDYGDATGTVRSMMVRLDDTEDMESFFREGARQIRALTGFDRVMVYRFDSDGSGEVVAEAARGGIGSFLGLHYPPSDIPKQARELYLRSLLRVITNIDAEPVPILPERDTAGKPLDLSLSVLRAVSPIHIEYLRNMGVSSSMSISLVVEGELWGLIACHHYTPRCPSFERRSVAELFAQLFSMRIESRERKETAAYERRARDVSDRLLGAVASDESMLKDPDWLADIITGAIPADGVGVWINGSYAFSGQTPDTEQFARIIRTLHTTAAGQVFATDNLSEILPSAKEHASLASGILAIPISRTPRDYVVLFRGERIRSVRWAGNPEKPIDYGPNGARLTPRESFAEWKQLVEGRSLPWTESEQRVADTLRATLIEVVLRMSDEANEERKAATDRQEVLIAELNHRVRNILSLIRGLIRQSKPEEGTSVEDFVALIDGRVHALARAHNQITDEVWGPARFRQLIDAEIAAFLDKQKDRVDMHGDPVLLKPQAYSTMALVIHELVTNSAKYGSLSEEGRVDLSWQRDEEGNLNIDWVEKDGPPVSPPKRKGFGTTIIGHSVPYDLGGQSSLQYHQDGLRAHFVIPARHVATPTGDEVDEALPAMTSSRPGAPKPPVDGTLLNGHDVLLVEDSLIIALDAEDILDRLGARNVMTEATVEGALAAIDRHLPTLALLDINLGDRYSFAVADVLSKKGVPFLFATGYGAQAKIPDQHADRIVMQKPYTMESVSRRLREFLSD